jgi:mannose-6-phosphate isomerase-like protein (cupin superfamily)
MDTNTVKLFAPAALRLHDGGAVTAEAPPRMAGDVDGWTIATFHVETSEDVHGDQWEMHPAGEEAVCALAGSARVILRRDEGGEEAPISLSAGTAYIVPRGRWHRLEIDGPTDLVSITQRNGTRLERLS